MSQLAARPHLPLDAVLAAWRRRRATRALETGVARPAPYGRSEAFAEDLDAVPPLAVVPQRRHERGAVALYAAVLVVATVAAAGLLLAGGAAGV